MKLIFLYSRAGTSMPVFRKHFDIEYSFEPDTVGRRIQKENGQRTTNRIGSLNSVEVLVAGVDSPQKLRQVVSFIEASSARVFLLETVLEGVPEVNGFDSVLFQLTASRLGVPLARSRFYVIGTRRGMAREALLRAVDRIKARETPHHAVVDDLPGPVPRLFIVPPLAKNDRAVFSARRPCPDLHRKSGAALPKSYTPHEVDSGPVSDAVLLPLPLISDICGIADTKRPLHMPRKLWIPCVGASLPPAVASVVAPELSALASLVASGASDCGEALTIRPPVLVKMQTKSSRLRCLLGEGLHNLKSQCSSMGIELLSETPVAVLYEAGRDPRTDARMEKVLDIKMVPGVSVQIKNRLVQTNRIDDVIYKFRGKTYHSRKQFMQAIQ